MEDHKWYIWWNSTPIKKQSLQEHLKMTNYQYIVQGILKEKIIYSFK